LEINYDHSKGVHTLAIARATLPFLLAGQKPASLLDVGCGTGNWLKVAQEMGVLELFGIDGIELAEGSFLFSKSLFRKIDLSVQWNLNRTFEMALCLEVAEHLPSASARIFIECLAKHSGRVIFSAAPPNQEGDHHLNCQWPNYWQRLFNDCGFVCDDLLRWQIWEESQIPAWYRQNIFVAVRNPELSGKEPRIRRVLHPAMFVNDGMPNWATVRSGILRQVEEGSQPFSWYLKLPFRSAAAKIRRSRSGRNRASTWPNG
jgi:SAM-dependent methyltransferase